MRKLVFVVCLAVWHPLSCPALCDKLFEITRPRPLKSSKVVHYSHVFRPREEDRGEKKKKRKARAHQKAKLFALNFSS